MDTFSAVARIVPPRPISDRQVGQFIISRVVAWLLHDISSNAPATLIFLGTKDSLIPVSTAEAFRARMEQAVGRCELVLFLGAGRPIYDYRRGEPSLREQILREADRFLADCLH